MRELDYEYDSNPVYRTYPNLLEVIEELQRVVVAQGEAIKSLQALTKVNTPSTKSVQPSTPVTNTSKL